MSPEFELTAEKFQLGNDTIEAMKLRLESLFASGKSVVLVIDGRAASGKSSLAKTLANQYLGRLVHMDDFFLPQELRTPDRLEEPGGNIHRERFFEDVMPILRKPKGFAYQVFDCGSMRLDQWRHLAAAQFTIVEGSYALHPKFGRYYDLSVFLSCSSEAQMLRLKARNPSQLDAFIKHWIPMEEKYFQWFNIMKGADFRLLT